MTKPVLEPAVSAGKPKKFLDQMRDVCKTGARFQAREANVVEAFAAANVCPGSVLDTSTATARSLANIGHAISFRAGFPRV